MRMQQLAMLVSLCVIWTAKAMAADATTNDWSVSFPAADASQRTRVHQVSFNSVMQPEESRPFYRFNQDIRPCYDENCPQPDGALQLNSSGVNDCWVQLAGTPPHNVRWDLEVWVMTNNVILVPEPNGIVFQAAGAFPGLTITPGWHRVSMDRENDRLTVRVDDVSEAVTFVAPDSRAPLRLTVRRKPLVWLRGSALYTMPGEVWAESNHGTEPAHAESVVWREVYRQPFDTADSVHDFSRENTNSTIAWVPEDKCMRLAADQNRGKKEVFATLNRNLPGDLRIWFRALNVEPNDHFFEVLISCKRIMPVEDGYDCSWNRGWMRRIKKADVQRIIVRPYEIQIDPPYWANYCIERVGDTITMYKNGSVSLKWTDPDPIIDPAFNKLSFYHCDVPMDFDDIIIERNARDISNELAAATAALPLAVTNGTSQAAKVRDPATADTVLVRTCTQTGTVQPASGGGVAPLAQFNLTDVRISNDTISFRWQAQAGVLYDVETCNSFSATVSWTAVSGWSGVSSTESVLTFSTPVSARGQSFYRVVARPSP